MREFFTQFKPFKGSGELRRGVLQLPMRKFMPNYCNVHVLFSIGMIALMMMATIVPLETATKFFSCTYWPITVLNEFDKHFQASAVHFSQHHAVD